MHPNTASEQEYGYKDLLGPKNTGDSADKHKRQAKRVDYREFGDKDDEFEAMLKNEEKQYQSSKRRKIQATEEAPVRFHMPCDCIIMLADRLPVYLLISSSVLWTFLMTQQS